MNEKADVLNAREAAEFLGAHVETVRRLARKGKIPAFKLGKDWRFLRRSVLRWIDEHQVQPQAPCILVVEDEGISRELIKNFLEAQGFRVCLAAHGREGLDCLDSERIDLVLLDLQMPVMNGPDFLQALRTTNEDLPVVILTGYPDSDLMTQALRFGPLILLAKPFQDKPLMQAVRAGLGVAGTVQGGKVYGTAGDSMNG